MSIVRPGLEQIDGSGATSGQVPVWNSDTQCWEPGTVSGGGGSLTVQDENGTVATGVTQIDFQGAGVTATAGTGEVVVTIPGGSGGSSRSYLGTNSVGGSTENMTLGRMYAKKVTAPSSGAVLQSVQAYFSQAATASFTMKGLVWADNAGTPGILLSATHATDVVFGSAGWRGFPLGIELAASTAYWIGVCVSNMPIGSGSMGIAYTGSGTDRYQQSGTVTQVGDWLSAFSPVTTTNNYSIRGLIVS